MKQRSSYELLGILERMDSLPASDVKRSLDNLSMTFSEWANLTNERFAGYDIRNFTAKQLKMLEDKKNITYEQYLEVKAKCKQFMRLSDDSNRAKVARGRRQYFLKDIQDGTYTEQELGVMTENEVSTLEDIETLWENVRAKYDPVQEIIRSSQKVSDVFKYGTSSDVLPFSIEEIKRNLSQLKKATLYLDQSKVLDDQCLELDSVLVRSMEEGLRGFETLKSSGDLTVDEFMTELGLDKNEVNGYFKKRMERVALGQSDAPSIRAREGKGFRLNEDGELEIIDESKAKDLIADHFFADKVLEEPIEALGRAEKYKTLVRFLETRSIYSVGTKEVEFLIEEINERGDTAVADWMIDNPTRYSAMLEALNEKGLNIDIDGIRKNLYVELQESYINDDRSRKITEFLDRVNYPSKEEEYEYEEENDGFTINEFGEIIRPEKKETTSSLEDMTIEELQKAVQENDKAIKENDKSIKQALVDKILSQQEIIEAQQAEIAQLRGEKLNEK